MRKVVALCLWALTAAGCSAALYGANGGREVNVTDANHDRDPKLTAGLRALRDGNLPRAEREFVKAGDRARLAETLIRQGRYDEAALAADGVEDGGAKLMLALVHQHRGDLAEYRRLLVQARNLGNVPALRLLERGDAA